MTRTLLALVLSLAAASTSRADTPPTPPPQTGEDSGRPATANGPNVSPPPQGEGQGGGAAALPPATAEGLPPTAPPASLPPKRAGQGTGAAALPPATAEGLPPTASPASLPPKREGQGTGAAALISATADIPNVSPPPQGEGQGGGAAALPPATAEGLPPDAPPPNPAPDTGVIPTLVAAGPGFLVHGLGTYVAGDRRTGKLLGRLQLAGLGTMLAAGIPLGISGASRHISYPTIPLVISGAGVFFMTWGADLWGAAGGGNIAGAPRLEPKIELDAGYGYVSDPRFSYGSFAVGRATLRHGPWSARPQAWIALDDDNQRVELEGAYRILGEAPAGRDGTYLEASVTGVYHHYGTEDFSFANLEALVAGRLHLRQIGEPLRGMFAELSTGIALQRIGYSTSTDHESMLLGGFGLGAYLGDGAGELFAFYDHRRDGFAAGLASGQKGNGFLGHFGLRAFYDVTDHWGVGAEFRYGSAYVSNVGLRYRWGTR